MEQFSASLTDSERAYAVNALKTTQTELNQALAGLTADQTAYHTAADRWSIANCAEHIALVEMGLFRTVQAGMTAPASPDKRADIRVTDTDVETIARNRAALLSAPESARPTDRFGDMASALQSFNQQRDKTIQYVETVQDDLRAHYFDRSPMGPLDIYQTILLMASHTDRHRQQIQEVKTSSGFPQ